MNLQSLVVVVLRLMALDFVLRVVLLWPPQMFVYFRKYEQIAQFEPSLTLALLPWLVFVGLLVCAVVIWFLADVHNRNARALSMAIAGSDCKF